MKKRLSERGRDFALFSGASAVSQVGSMSVAAAGPLLALTLTGSPVAAGYVTAASVLPGLALHVPAGLLVDRVSRRRVMFASQLLRMASAIAAFACLALGNDAVLVLVLAALVDGVCSVFYEVAEIATVPDLVSKKSLNLAIGSNEAKLNASMLFGRPLGGALLAVHPVMPWLVTALTSFFPMVALMAMRRRGGNDDPARPESRPPDPGARAGPTAGEGKAKSPGAKVKSPDLALRSALGGLMRDPFSRAVLAVCVLANFFFQIIVLQQILLAEQKGLPSYLVGVLLACSGLGGFLGAVVSPCILRRNPPSMSVILFVLAWIPLTCLVALGDNPVTGLVLWGLCSVIGAGVNVALRAHHANVFPSESLGRVTGITRFLSVGAVALGAFSGGWIIRFLGVRGTGILIVAAFAVIAVVLLGLLYLVRVRNAAVAAAAKVRGTVREMIRAPGSQEQSRDPAPEHEVPSWSEGRHDSAVEIPAPAVNG